MSSRASRILLEAIEQAGLSPEPLVEGLPLTLDELRDPRRRLDWDMFAQVCERIPHVIAGKMTPEQLGAHMLVVPSFEFLRRAGQLMVSPHRLYQLGTRMMSTALFMNVIVRDQMLPSGRLVVTGELLPGYRESETFFRLSHGSVAALPRLLDLPDCTIEEQRTTGRTGHMVLTLPRSHTLGARVRRGVRALLSAGDIYQGVRSQQAEIASSLAALRTSRHEMRELMERLPEGVIVHRGGVIAWANASVLGSLGIARLDDIIGKSVLDFVPGEDRAVVEEALGHERNGALGDVRVEYRALRPDGSVRWMEAGTAQQVEFEGAPARLVVLRDVTEQRQLEEQLALADRLASIGTLAAGVAHEINNPLAYAHTSLEVASRELQALGDPERTARVEEAIGWARQGTERVRAIVRDLKTFSRAEAEPIEAVDLPALLDSTLALAANAIATKAQVVRRYEAGVPAMASKARLGQVFLNLLLNAADAIPEGAPSRHEIRVSTALDASGRVVIAIADSGSGIPPNLSGRIFDPFFTTKPVGAGTGLGLAVCHRIVTQLGGDIRFESTPGMGTTFRVTLPAGDVSAIARVAPPLARGTAETDLIAPRGRLLVVDDEPALLRSVRALLSTTHEVVTASSGRQALELLRADPDFDAVLADLMMADVTGMELYDAVLRDHPELATRFVFMTGGTFTDRGRAFLEQVPNRCLEKPFDADTLLDVVAAMVPPP